MRLYEISNADHDLISFLIFYGFVWIMLLLNCFADKEQMEFKYPRTPVCDGFWFCTLILF